MKSSASVYLTWAGYFGISGVIFVFVCLILGTGHLGWADEVKEPKRVAVLISQKIRPYLQAVDGFEKELKKRIPAKVESYPLEKESTVSLDVLRRKIVGANYDLVLAVGPEALHFLWSDKISDKTVRSYAMVLSPAGLPPGACGVPLDIPVGLEIRNIARAFPSLHRLGILYDASHNHRFVQEAMEQSHTTGLEIVPLNVSSKREIPLVLGPKWNQLDGLWLIPDPTVISESLVRYLIKEALSRGVPVIGYNRFFYRSGATLSFILNYEEIGKQAAGIALKLLSGEACGTEIPFFRTWLNLKVIDALGIPSVKDSSLGIEPGP